MCFMTIPRASSQIRDAYVADGVTLVEPWTSDSRAYRCFEAGDR